MYYLIINIQDTQYYYPEEVSHPQASLAMDIENSELSGYPLDKSVYETC